MKTVRDETFKTVIEACEADDVKSTMVCTHNMDITIEMICTEGKIVNTGIKKNGNYFVLSKSNKEIVEQR